MLYFDQTILDLVDRSLQSNIKWGVIISFAIIFVIVIYSALRNKLHISVLGLLLLFGIAIANTVFFSVKEPYVNDQKEGHIVKTVVEAVSIPEDRRVDIEKIGYYGSDLDNKYLVTVEQGDTFSAYEVFTGYVYDDGDIMEHYAFSKEIPSFLNRIDILNHLNNKDGDYFVVDITGLMKDYTIAIESVEEMDGLVKIIEDTRGE